MKIALLDDYLGLAATLVDWSPVTSRATLEVIDRPLPDVETAAAALAGYDILCTLRERTSFPGELIKKLPKLRYLCVTGKRYDTVDVATAAMQGVVVSNTPVSGAGAGAVAELTWGLILSLARNIAFEDRHMRQGEWQHGAGYTLRGKTLGVVGLGGLGRDVARIGQAFGMQVQAWSPNLTDARAEEAGVTRVSKHDLFATSDVVSLHLALADSTRGIVDKAAIDAMKPSAWLVNTARACLLDEHALIDALKQERIQGAGLDVYSVEPLPEDHILRSLPNVVLTPHLGYFTQEMLTAYYTYAVENITAFLDGKPIRVVS
ncbi:D-2-hydroxyacid dehydrogenase family protein [Pseudomonas sp. CCM 7891]|uniref:D-2-hydroxyacid dehydrogenase family protein n=1 Tax=Pseudomonas karstica TaxID=1055468 RepID=A0A7X2V0Z6_9PSED|nr:D-2-hydroxyacid dehydrogenase family protein [Pseudomonas karstica]MTD22108.1 D-2-hydroxyacid dehydrogenase family protein [Pseudomonas karstica]